MPQLKDIETRELSFPYFFLNMKKNYKNEKKYSFNLYVNALKCLNWMTYFYFKKKLFLFQWKKISGLTTISIMIY